jgi:hypothetical protein
LQGAIIGCKPSLVNGFVPWEWLRVEWFNTYSANAREVVSSVLDEEGEDTDGASEADADADADKTYKRLSDALSTAVRGRFAEVSVNPWDIQLSAV